MVVDTAIVKVLLVDDQESYRSAARLVVDLTDGFEVTAEAESGEQAVDLALAMDVDLVLMDINMGGIDGLEATRRIYGAGGPPVLVLSTYSAEEVADRAIESGAIGFVSKADFDPFSLSDIWRAFRAD